MKHFKKRCFSLFLSFAILFQTIIYFPAKAANSADGSGTVALGRSAIAYSQKLTDNGNGTYTLSLTMKDASNVSDVSMDDTVSRNNYFTAPANGDYLIELWGGTGGNGSNNGNVKGGTGGKAGHVYGVVTLKKGETLYYQLGGNGNATLKSDEGGGVNGNGGASGGLSSYSVGGGGGYSAIYKFAAGEFESAYLDSEGNMTVDNISESDRVSKFIAIAAGGGGGGAGSIGSEGIFGLGILTDKGYPPNGGNGGSMNSMSVAVAGGTVFIGSDGSSSGTSTTYVGLGGTDVPASYANTITSMFGTVQANDWYAVTNTDLSGGAGGSGNLRGGGGGAGYAGGGGGIQESILRAAHVGGGGGGSSYLSDEVSAPTAAQIAAMGDKADGGGAIRITPVAGVVSDELKGVALTITPSEYFTVSVNGLSDEGTLDISNTAQTVEIVFSPISGFAGGNNVPLLEDNAIPCENKDGTGCSIPLKADCAAVNVPLNFAVDAVNHTTNVRGEKHFVDDLHGTAYTDLELTQTIYAFIDSVSGYTVDVDDDQTYVEEENAVYPQETSYYTVSITVTPKTSNGYAAVGTPVKTKTFTKEAAIIVLLNGALTLNGNSIGYSKTLEYDSDGNYVLSLITDISSDSTQHTASPQTYSTAGTATYNVDYSGYYAIQAWGANGGKGGKVIGNDGTCDGGPGGKGAYQVGYIYLTSGTQLSLAIGEEGNSPTDITSSSATNEPGGAGGSTIVKQGESGLLYSGGGGGGGAGWRYDSSIYNSGRTGEKGTKLHIRNPFRPYIMQLCP